MRAIAALAACLAALPAGAAPDASLPSFRWRGVFEGFYGRPWTWRQRAEMAAWMGRRGFNLLVIGPKDEPLQRARWREPLPPAYLDELRALARKAAASGVELGWVLSPGLDFRGTLDAEEAAAKLEAVAAAGVRHLALAFDDTPSDAGHVDFANSVLRRLRESSGDVVLTFIPAEYWGDAAPSPYLEAVARRLDSRFRVGWTGPQIISRTITEEHARRFREYIRHPLVLGDNYPVQDRLMDSGRLFLGPLTGRDPGLARLHDGYLANATPLPEAAKPALATAGAFARAPGSYDPGAAWRSALDELARPEARGAMRLFASQNASSWLAPSASELEPAIAGYADGRDRRSLPALLAELAAADARLSRGAAAGFYAEARPWSAKLSLLARAAQAAIGGDERARRLQLEADRNPAVVADLAFERLLARLLPPGRSPGPYCGSLAAELRRFAAGDTARRARLAHCLDDLAAAARRNAGLDPDRLGLAADLSPLSRILAARARAARRALDGRPPSRWADRLEAWSFRLSLLPLLSCRTLLDRYIGVRDRPLPWPMSLWLAWQRLRRPSGIPARLSAGLNGGEGLENTLREIAAYSAGARLGGEPEELGPWLRKTEDYGLLGLKRLRGEEISALERERLRSGNGLELALELKQALDAFVRWSRLPEARRPAELDLSLPANPADLL